MLLQFKFKNYKCFYEETILDLMATQEKRHLETTTEINGNHVLPVIAIHGANAAGKSSVLEALEYMFYIIKNSNKFDVNTPLPVNPYLFKENARKENSEFEVSICLGNYEYRYGFSLNKNKIEEEWLYKKRFSLNSKAQQKMIFERRGKLVDFGTSYKNYEKMWNFFNKEINLNIDKLLVLSTIAPKEEKGIFRDLYSFILKSNVIIESSFKNLTVDILDASDSRYDKFQEIIQEFDPCILDVKVEKKEENENKYDINVLHLNLDDKSNPIVLPLQNESNGTIKIFNIIPKILKNLETGGVICIDELDVKLHPLLFRKIVMMYVNKFINHNNAQLIFTAHSTYLFNSNDLRRDELYIVDKDLIGKSKLYSLSEFRNLRVDADYEKKYLSGQFGGIPFKF